MEDTSERLKSAPLVFLAPIGQSPEFYEDFLVSDGQNPESFDASRLTQAQWIQNLENSDTITVFLDAKPALRFLLEQGVEVARPICLKTLGILAEADNFPLFFEDLAEGMELFQQMHSRFRKLMAQITQKKLTKVARLECLCLIPFAAMENRGLPLDRTEWINLVNKSESEKIKNSYGEGFLKYHSTKTGRIHAQFDPIGASTGRVSSHHPNLQNLPRDERFHACIAPGGNRFLISADYAAFELRILAGLSRDTVLIDAFAKDQDIHAAVASGIFGTTVSKSEHSDLRDRAKAVNFGLVYGMGAGGLGKRLGISTSEAHDLMERYFATYPTIKSYLDKSVKDAFERGYSKTRLGRKLYHDLNGNEAERLRIERVAKNMPIQGCAADIVKLAMVHLYKNLKGLDAGMVNMIHDEIVVECLHKDVDLVAKIVQETMEDAQAVFVPEVKPKVDVSIGKCWIH